MANTLLIVEDHPIVVNGLENLFLNHDEFKIIGIAGTAKVCLDFLKFNQPDIILMDINLPDIQGTALCKKILELYPTQKVLAISMLGDPFTVKEMLTNGAMGYILKNAPSTEILDALHTILEGEKYLCGEISKINNRKNAEILLTRRELEVLRLLSDGFTNNEIAEKLFISHFTVDSHRKNLLLKFNAKNVASLIKIAVTKKII